MATKNFFDLLGDDENEDPSQVVVRMNSISTEAQPTPGVVKRPSVPAKTTKSTPAEAVKDSPRGQYDGPRAGRGGGRVGRSGRGNYGDRDGASREGGYRERNNSNDRGVSQTRDADGFVGSRSSFVEKSLRMENAEGRYYEGGHGEGRGGRGHGEGEERSRRREFDRHSGNARGNETEKRAGAGRGNWGTDVDIIEETAEAAKDEEAPAVEADAEMKPGQEVFAEATLEETAADTVKGEEEDNEMTLEEYEKVLEAKRKALEAEKASERKVEVDKAFEKMQLVDNKKREKDIFIKLGQDKDKEKVKREAAEREEKSRKPVSINEFLKPAEGGKYYGPSPNRGRGGRGSRGDRREGGDRRDVGGRCDRDPSRSTFGGGRFGGTRGPTGGGASAPKIEDQVQFPTLGGK